MLIRTQRAYGCNPFHIRLRLVVHPTADHFRTRHHACFLADGLPQRCRMQEPHGQRCGSVPLEP